MRHFVRFAKATSKGAADRGGWRLRIFLTAGEAGEFAERLGAQLWLVETGFYHDESDGPTGLARGFRTAPVIPADRSARR